MLIDDSFHRQGLRDRVQIELYAAEPAPRALFLSLTHMQQLRPEIVVRRSMRQPQRTGQTGRQVAGASGAT